MITSINPLVSSKTVLGTDWTLLKLSNEPVNLLSYCIISIQTDFIKLNKTLRTVYNEFINFISKQSNSILFTVLLTKLGILLRSCWVNLVVCAFSYLPKDFRFSIYSSFKSLTTNVEPGSIPSCSNTKLIILSYTCTRLHFYPALWLMFSLSVLMHRFQIYLSHFSHGNVTPWKKHPQ